ncbi:LOW QUALITY PROTEIN: nuclear pore complex protein Nup50-like [Macrobrachium nipponense]|uniref:LOW QUALITY PROTEIN: nuclear pore complex protein Nup50-like n=1 Tax=Macrobrachium nipponense TaxID=159736 RepID=UPI0030C85661
MAKRTATRELTHDNWEAEEEREEMGTFRQASEEQLATRKIKTARRRGTMGKREHLQYSRGCQSSLVLIPLQRPLLRLPFNFLNSISKESSDNSSSKLNSNCDPTPEKTSQPLKVTQDSALSNAKGSESKLKGPLDNKEVSEEEGKSTVFLTHLKALNEGVVVWIKKHLDKNPHVNLTPVFDDYKKHFSELLKKYPPEEGSSKESEGASSTNSSKKDLAVGKENTPVVPEVSKETTTVKPFTFGLQTTAAEKPAESVKSIFTFGSNSNDSEKKAAPMFTFTGFGNSSQKSEGLSFGNSNSNSSSSGLFGGFNSSSTKDGNTGFSFGVGSTSATSENKDDGDKTEEASDEPPKVEVNEVKEEGAFYDKKCKLFYMKDGAYVDRGVGTLYLKKVDEKTQLLVRAYTNLGNILLNIVLNNSVPAVRAGKNGVIIVCVPNPPIETDAEKAKEPTKMLIRVKTTEDADALLEKIQENKN